MSATSASWFDDGQTRSAAGPHNPWLIAVVISLATFMQVLDTSIANVALRQIAGSLAASQDESTWILTSYLVASAVILPISGWLSNVIGRKRFYMGCVAIFTASSLLCGFAPNLSILIICRVLQGLGGGGMAPSEQSMLADTFPPQKRSQAFALYGIAIIVAPTVGPALGGWLTDHFSWHWIFFINVPVGAASLLLVNWLVHEPTLLERERRERLAGGIRVDWVGFALVAVGLGCLEVVLDNGQTKDWFSSSFIVSFAVISALSLICLVPWELSRKDPIFDVRLIFRRQFGTCCLVMMAVGAVLFGSTQLLPQLLQTNYGYTATLSGLVLMPGGIATFLLMPIAGNATNLIQPKYLIALGLGLVAVAFWHLMAMSPDADFGFFAWARIYQMVGLPFLFIPLTTASYAGLPPDKTSEASSIINVARNVGGSIGISLMNTAAVQGAQMHQSRLVSHLVPSSLPYQEAIRQGNAFFMAQGSGILDAQKETMAWLGQLVQSQAALLAYIDVFRDLAIAAALMIPLALLLRHVDRRQVHAGH